MKNLIRGKTLFILLSAATFLFVACGQSKQLASLQQTETDSQAVLQTQAVQAEKAAFDSLLYSYQTLQMEMTELKATFAQSIPAAQAQVTIPMQSLNDLPEGAKFVDSSGRATVDTLANATLAISYISDKTGDTNSIVVAIDEAGILIFKRLKIDYNGIEASATTLESNIQRHGNDTVSGSAQLRLSIFNGLQTRQCDMDVVAVRAPL